MACPGFRGIGCMGTRPDQKVAEAWEEGFSWQLPLTVSSYVILGPMTNSTISTGWKQPLNWETSSKYHPWNQSSTKKMNRWLLQERICKHAVIKQVLVCPETLVLRRLIGIMQGKKCGDGFPVGVKKKRKKERWSRHHIAMLFQSVTVDHLGKLL